MNLHDYLHHSGISQTELAAAFGVSQSMLWQWANNRRPIPANRCLAIERATGGLVTRGDLRPADAHMIWPDVPQPGENPDISTESQRRAA